MAGISEASLAELLGKQYNLAQQGILPFQLARSSGREVRIRVPDFFLPQKKGREGHYWRT